MSNITVSTAIDGFLTASNKPGARSAIGLGTTDTVEFGEIATSQLNFPNLTTAELNAVTDATAGDTYFDSDRSQFVRFTGPASYDVISTITNIQRDVIAPNAAITLQAAKFFEAGLLPTTSNVFAPANKLTIFTEDAFSNAAGPAYFYNDGTGGVVSDVGWLDVNNPFSGIVTSPVVVPNKVYRLTTNTSSGTTSFIFNKVLTSTSSSTQIFTNPLQGGSEYKIELTVFIGDLLSGNLKMDLNYTGVYNNSTIKIKVDDIKEKNQVGYISGNLVENDFLNFSDNTKLGFNSPLLGLYTITMVIRPSSDGTFSAGVEQISSNTKPLLLGKAETTLTKLV